MSFKFRPGSPEFQKNPHETFDYMRENHPVYISDQGFVTLTRYEDVAATLRNPRMSVQYTDYAEGGAAKYLAKMKALQQSNPLIGNWRTMLRVDDPLHDKLKKFALPLFSNANALRISGEIEKIISRNIDNAFESGPAELVSQVTVKTAQDTVCYLVDAPEEDKDQICQWADALTMVFEPLQSATEGTDNVEKLLPLVIGYLHNHIQKRANNPQQNDIITHLLNDEVDGYKLEYPEVIGMVAILFVAGIETATYFMANAVHTLLTVPGAKEQFAEIINEIDTTTPQKYNDPTLNTAIEELLRYSGSVWQTMRVNLDDTEYTNDGTTTTIPQGSLITVSIAAANRDPRIFDEPHRLNLRRPNAKKNIGFSAGGHYCLGANIAKVQASALLMDLFTRYPNIELAETPTWRNRMTFRGIEKLVVTNG